MIVHLLWEKQLKRSEAKPTCTFQQRCPSLHITSSNAHLCVLPRAMPTFACYLQKCPPFHITVSNAHLCILSWAMRTFAYYLKQCIPLHIISSNAYLCILSQAMRTFAYYLKQCVPLHITSSDAYRCILPLARCQPLHIQYIISSDLCAMWKCSTIKEAYQHKQGLFI